MLLVDRNPAEARAIDRILESAYTGTCALQQAYSLDKATALLKIQKVDVILLDSDTIESQNAKDLIPVLKVIDRQVPTVLISSYAAMDYIEIHISTAVHRIVDKFFLRKHFANDSIKTNQPDFSWAA